MAVTNHYRVNSPGLGVRFNAPNGYWVIPANASSTTINFAAASVCTLTLFSHNQTANTDPFSLSINGSSGNIATSSGHNGTDVFTAGFTVTSGSPAWVDVWFSAYTGAAYPLLRLRRGGVWVALSGDKILIRRSGAWVQINSLQVRRSGAWANPS